MHILQFARQLLHKRNFPGKPGRVRNKVSLPEHKVATVLTSFVVYLIPAPVLDVFQGVYVCAHPVI